jgi:hypothetical protein
MNGKSVKPTIKMVFCGFLLVFYVIQVAVWADDSLITVTVNEEKLQFDVPPIIVRGRAMVPMRGVYEALGAEVSWDAASRTVTGTKGGTVIQLPVGSTTAQVNGRPVQIDVPALIEGGRTMIPVRFIGESLGAEVNWVPESRTVAIKDAEAPVSFSIEDDEIPLGVRAPSDDNADGRLELELIEAYRFAYSLEDRLYENKSAYVSRDQVHDFFRQGFTADFANELTDYYWQESEGLLSLGSYLVLPEMDIHVLDIDPGREARLWHETDEWDRMHWGMERYKIITLRMENGKWKVHDEASTADLPV